MLALLVVYMRYRLSRQPASSCTALLWLNTCNSMCAQQSHGCYYCAMKLHKPWLQPGHIRVGSDICKATCPCSFEGEYIGAGPRIRRAGSYIALAVWRETLHSSMARRCKHRSGGKCCILITLSVDCMAVEWLYVQLRLPHTDTHAPCCRDWCRSPGRRPG